jgi:hypothetical protein
VPLNPGLKFGLNPPLNPGLNAPGKGAKLLDSNPPSLFHSEPSFHPEFQLGLLKPPLKPPLKPFHWLKPLNGVFQFHAPGKLFPQLPPKPFHEFVGEFQPENGVFQFPPKFPPKPDQGVDPEFQFHAPGKLLPQFPPKFPPKLLPQFEGKPPENPGNPKPVPGKFDVNGVLNMLCFLFSCRGVDVITCETGPRRCHSDWIGKDSGGLLLEGGEVPRFETGLIFSIIGASKSCAQVRAYVARHPGASVMLTLWTFALGASSASRMAASSSAMNLAMCSAVGLS